MMLREKPKQKEDNGVWIATTKEHHQSLQREFPHMRSIQLACGEGSNGWQVLPADAPDFESTALRVCDLILARDPRIGKIPERPAPPETEDPVGPTQGTFPLRTTVSGSRRVPLARLNPYVFRDLDVAMPRASSSDRAQLLVEGELGAYSPGLQHGHCKSNLLRRS